MHIPKGSMCGSCKKVSLNCSTLDFKSMKAIKKHSDGTVVVKCDYFSTGAKKPLNGQLAVLMRRFSTTE